MKKWIFRLLILFAVICALALFGLKIISGTSDSHKRGLEQAFSQIFVGDATFGALKTFNLFPQFTIEIEKLAISRIKGSGNMNADSMVISFGPIDLLMKSRVIENFHIKNLVIDEGVYTPLALRLNDAGVYPDEKTKAASFNFTGSYGAQELAGQFAMDMKDGFRPKYFFSDENPFTMNVGSVQISGLLYPYKENGTSIGQLKMFAQKKDGKVECNLPDDKTMELSAFFKNVVGGISAVKAPSDLTKLCDSLQK